jgi:hypothetical protein
MSESLEWIREMWAGVPVMYRVIGGLVLFWGAVFIFYGRKSIS